MNSTMIVNNFKRNLLFCFIYSIPFLLSTTCQAQYRPSLFLREDWKETPPATPVNQDHVANPNLVLGLYGAAVDSMKKSNHDRPVDDPFYVWSGLCNGNWALTLKDPGSFVDLSEYAKIKWRTKQSGFRCLRILLKLADGTWLVSDQCDRRSVDWRIREFNISDIKWYTLDIGTITERQPVDNPDLTKVDEIGFKDLMAGGRSAACSRVDWIEVYGKTVNR
jgi:hypothetical protein